jgi:hypothetical protein
MPLVGTSASITAKGYGFGLVSSVNNSASVTGTSATARVGTVTAFSPKPKPANQYWGAVRFTQISPPFGTQYTVGIDVFRFDNSPSPAITSVSSGAILGEVTDTKIPIIASTNNGVTYVFLGYNSSPTPKVGTSIKAFDLSTGAAPTITTPVQFSYDTTGSVQFRQSVSLSARPSGTRVAVTTTYLDSSANTRYAVNVWNTQTNGTGFNGVFSSNPLSVSTYNQFAIALNPVYEEFLVICGNLVANPGGNGYLWMYKNWGDGLSETFAETQAASNSAFRSVLWSNRGIYLLATTSNGVNYIYKMNTSSGALTFLTTYTNSSSIVGWTLDDSSIIFSNGAVLVRTGDSFAVGATVSIPGTNSQPAFNYNGGYLFAASLGQTNTQNLKVYEYEGPNLLSPAVISANFNSFTYRANAAFPRFDGEG